MPSGARPILVDGRAHNVTTNLERALHRLCLRDSRAILSEPLFAIVQEDVAEKGRQVGRMGEVYAKWHRVCPWLGKES